jgi:hypothetical protein
MPVLTLEKPAVRSVSPAFRALASGLRQPLRMPTWAVAAAVLMVGIAAFAAGRHKPAHHYVAYFGYPLVLDTTTGKACYAAPPKRSEVQDAAFAIDGAVPADGQTQSGPAIPMCGKE